MLVVTVILALGVRLPSSRAAVDFNLNSNMKPERTPGTNCGGGLANGPGRSQAGWPCDVGRACGGGHGYGGVRLPAPESSLSSPTRPGRRSRSLSTWAVKLSESRFRKVELEMAVAGPRTQFRVKPQFADSRRSPAPGRDGQLAFEIELVSFSKS